MCAGIYTTRSPFSHLWAPTPPAGIGRTPTIRPRPSDPIPSNLFDRTLRGSSLAAVWAAEFEPKGQALAKTFASHQLVTLQDREGFPLGTACWLSPELLITAFHVASQQLYCHGWQLRGDVRILGDVLLIRPIGLRGPATKPPLATDTPTPGDPLYFLYHNGLKPLINLGTALSAPGFPLQSLTHVRGEGGSSGGVILNHLGQILSLHLGRLKHESSLRLQIPLSEIIAKEQRHFGTSWLDDISDPRTGRVAWGSGSIDGVPEMKRRLLERELKDLGWSYLRAGGEHDIWTNGKEQTSVPRHTEINEITAKAILKFATAHPPAK